MEAIRDYSEGDWIVHANYGIGQIICTEVKSISGEETKYFRIQSEDSTFWIPVEQMDSEVLRPLSTHEEIEQAIATLQKPPREMSSNHTTRQSRIRAARSRNTPRAIARVIRDLRAYQRAKGGLNTTESSAFRNLKQHLVDEWAIVTGKETTEVASKLDYLLNVNKTALD